jgi:cytochrome c oxidase subunit 2
VLDVLQPTQSALAAASPAAALAGHVATALAVGAACILVLAMAVALRAMLGKPRPVRARRWLLCGGLVLPGIGLAALAATSAWLSLVVSADAEPAALRIEISGRQFWWEVRYVGREGKHIVLANELHLPVGTPVLVRATSADVIHGFWVPPLAGKVDMIPGRTRELRITASRAGVFRGQCSAYCGTQHARMALHVVAEDPIVFQSWLAQQAAPAMPPADASSKEGRDIFLRSGCGGCHTVRGSEAQGEIGPDLTHVGSRRTLAAGTLINHAGSLAAWVSSSQHIKPGNLMPSAAGLTPRELDLVVAYLQSLR